MENPAGRLLQFSALEICVNSLFNNLMSHTESNMIITAFGKPEFVLAGSLQVVLRVDQHIYHKSLQYPANRPANEKEFRDVGGFTRKRCGLFAGSLDNPPTLTP
jgi:hypothetical protein